jgi:hypothetical protein
MWPDQINGQSDLEFVEDLYLVEAEDAFDILAIRLDGGINSPDDRRVSPTRAGFSRAILFRELMVEAQGPVHPGLGNVIRLGTQYRNRRRQAGGVRRAWPRAELVGVAMDGTDG